MGDGVTNPDLQRNPQDPAQGPLGIGCAPRGFPFQASVHSTEPTACVGVGDNQRKPLGWGAFQSDRRGNPSAQTQIRDWRRPAMSRSVATRTLVVGSVALSLLVYGQAHASTQQVQDMQTLQSQNERTSLLSGIASGLFVAAATVAAVALTGPFAVAAIGLAASGAVSTAGLAAFAGVGASAADDAVEHLQQARWELYIQDDSKEGDSTDEPTQGTTHSIFLRRGLLVV
jgi:hypothetical protein